VASADRVLILLSTVRKWRGSEGHSAKGISQESQMPLYEFRCPSCGEKFEEIVRVTQTDQVVCPECGGEKPERQMSVFATVGDSSSSFASSSSSGCGGSSGFS